MRRLPKGEETIPIIEVEGRFLTLAELKAQYPELYRKLLEPRTLEFIEVSEELLVERVRRRIAQGRVMTIYRFDMALTPEEQLAHMEARDDIGMELIEAERRLLEEELRLLRE